MGVRFVYILTKEYAASFLLDQDRILWCTVQTEATDIFR